jgi:hypothetical protein
MPAAAAAVHWALAEQRDALGDVNACAAAAAAAAAAAVATQTSPSAASGATADKKRSCRISSSTCRLRFSSGRNCEPRVPPL